MTCCQYVGLLALASIRAFATILLIEVTVAVIMDHHTKTCARTFAHTTHKSSDKHKFVWGFVSFVHVRERLRTCTKLTHTHTDRQTHVHSQTQVRERSRTCTKLTHTNTHTQKNTHRHKTHVHTHVTQTHIHTHTTDTRGGGWHTRARAHTHYSSMKFDPCV